MGREYDLKRSLEKILKSEASTNFSDEERSKLEQQLLDAKKLLKEKNHRHRRNKKRRLEEAISSGGSALSYSEIKYVRNEVLILRHFLLSDFIVFLLQITFGYSKANQSGFQHRSDKSKPASYLR